jgi:hypothetical protein
MSMITTALIGKSKAAIEWYWNHGIRRTDPRFEVPRGAFLDGMYRCHERLRVIQRAADSAKPCMAIWGPSQSGKSTLLSGYLDEPGDDLGDRSALKWHDSEPVRFVVGREKGDKVIVLNPFNFEADASGCVSRFVLRSEVEDALHPVELRLATEGQIMHALAVGYLSECAAKNQQNEVTKWNQETFSALLDRQKSAGSPAVNRAAFELLQQLANTLELLILSQLPRYEDLAALWEKNLRPRLLQIPALLARVEAVEQFAYEVFWDNWSSISQTFQALATKRRLLFSQWGERPVRIAYSAAAVLLDIDAYRKFNEVAEYRRKVQALTAVDSGQSVTIGSGHGSPLAPNDREFGLFQALVWELRIPVRRDVLQQRAPALFGFLEKSDLLDFPGVANSQGKAEKHDNASVENNLQIALTEVLKRGKTASIVVTSARDLDIDGFSLLMRLGRFPSQPSQLVSGIRSWMRAFDKKWPPEGKSMPLNMVVTFCAKLINQVNSAGVRDGLKACFEQLKDIGCLSDPRHVTAFATNYPQFDDGKIHGTPEEQLASLNNIVADRDFEGRFGKAEESFRQMLQNGGTDYFFRALSEQAVSSKRVHMLQERQEKIAEEMQQLILQHIPRENAAADERNREIDAWIQGIHQRLREPQKDADSYYQQDPSDTATNLSFQLRSFLNIDPEALDEIPQNANQMRLNVRGFIDRQFRAWMAMQARFNHISEIGLASSEKAARVLSYLVEAAEPYTSIETFFRENLGSVRSRVDGRQKRRFLAVEMSNALLNRVGLMPAVHRPLVDRSASAKKDVRAILEELAIEEESHDSSYEKSPHFSSVIQPLLNRLEEIKRTSSGARPAQHGDEELLVIARTAEP